MTHDAGNTKIPVTLLTGFLGSGKTTLLNRLVRKPELTGALVIINEFGEMALDHLLVTHSTEDLVVEMGDGCLCCTVRGDLVKTLQDALWRFSRAGQRQFQRVVIETTGLADPVPIVHTLLTHPDIAPHYRLDGVVVTMDLATGEASLDLQEEAVRQAAMADVLLLTKADLADELQRHRLLQRLDRINPAATRWDVSHGEIAAGKLLDIGMFSPEMKVEDVRQWLREEAYQVPPPVLFQLGMGSLAAPMLQDHDVNRHDDQIRAFCFSVEEPIDEIALSIWLEVLTGLVGSDILRIKGILNIQGRAHPLVIHGAQHVFHPPVMLLAWPDADRRSRIVFITRGVEREFIEKSFQGFSPSRTAPLPA